MSHVFIRIPPLKISPRRGLFVTLDVLQLVVQIGFDLLAAVFADEDAGRQVIAVDDLAEELGSLLRVPALVMRIFCQELGCLMGGVAFIGSQLSLRELHGRCRPEFCPERAGTDSRYLDVEGRQFFPQDQGQADDGKFGRTVGTAAGKTHEPALGGDVQDHTPFLLAHIGQDSPRSIDDTEIIGFH